LVTVLTLAKFVGVANAITLNLLASALLGQNDPILWPRQAYLLRRTAGGNFTNGTTAEWKYRLVIIL
jgi:hypothetical protein